MADIDRWRLNAALAVHLFEWRWMKWTCTRDPRDPVLTGIVPPGAPDRIFPNGWAERWQPSDSQAPRFSNWDQPVWYDGDVLNHDLPDYLTWAGMKLVVEAMQAKGWEFVQITRALYQNRTDGWSWSVRFAKGQAEEVWRSADEAPVAAGLAALRAVAPEVAAELEKGEGG